MGRQQLKTTSDSHIPVLASKRICAVPIHHKTVAAAWAGTAARQPFDPIGENSGRPDGCLDFDLQNLIHAPVFLPAFCH